jgi:serine/threonine protein kinase
LDKLWLLDTPRENAKSLLDSDKQLIVDEEINKFLSLSFGESINRIYNYFFKNKTIDVQLSQIEQKFIVSQGITANQLKISIHNEVKKACSTFKSVNEVPLSRAISLANAWSTCNRNKSAYLELLYRVILRLIINLEEDAEKDHVISIERAIEEELCCIHRQFYFNYTIVELFGSDFKEVIESKYEEYRTDMYTVFKLWLCFLISQETTKTPLESIQVIIDKYFPLFINHSSKPTTLKVFLDTDKKEIHVPKVETLININDADLDMFIDSSSNKFLVSSLLKDQLSDNGIEITEFEKFTSDKYLTALWSNILGVDTKELVTLTLLQNFIEVGGKGKEKGKDAKYFASRGKIREAFIVKRRGALFQMLNAQTFSSIIFNYNKSFEDKLKNKIEVLSHVSSLESDRYDIENKLGQGAFGVVYKAKDLMFESIVAIKLIPHWFHSEGVSKRLIKEAAIMRNSQHENVVVVYDLVKLPAHKLTISEECKLNHLHVFDDNEEVFALVMEEINGGVTLEQHILSTDWKSLSYEQKLDFFQDICFGVKSLHNQGVVHGDIKPQNILVGKNGKPKIADFGIASSSGDKSIGITNPTFISINKLNGGKSDFQDDIYSLGMLLLYLFSPSIVNEFKRKNVNKLIVEKELLHLALLSLNANANSDGYYKKGYIHRYTFPDSQILELMDDDIAEIFLEDPIAKHSYYKDVVHNIDINTFNDGEWDKPNLYLYSLIEVIFRCISTKGSTTKARLYNLVNELHPSNENYIHIEELYLNTNNVQDINELIFEIKSAANSDVLEFNYNDYRCLKLPTYLNEVLTLENLEFYSKHINFEELCKISANYKLNDITFLGGTKYDNNNTFLWTVGNKLYKGSSAGLENYFGEALYKTKLLKVMGQTYGDLFSFVHDVLELEMIPNRCLSLLTNIKPCLSYKPFSLGSLKRRDCSQYKLPEKLGENITLFYKVEEAFILYQEVLNVFLNSGKEVDIEFESDDDYANALSTGASTVEPPTFSGNVIEFNAKLTSGEQLSLIQDDNLIASINAFVSTKGSKSFNRFYGSCFDYQKLRKSVVEWKQLDNENAIDEYIDVKTQYIGSIEYELLQMYVRSGDKEIHIFSR